MKMADKRIMKEIDECLKKAQSLINAGIPLIPQFEGYVSISAQSEHQVNLIKTKIGLAINAISQEMNNEGLVCEVLFGKLSWTGYDS